MACEYISMLPFYKCLQILAPRIGLLKSYFKRRMSSNPHVLLYYGVLVGRLYQEIHDSMTVQNFIQ
jgi:hypothetical protein